MSQQPKRLNPNSFSPRRRQQLVWGPQFLPMLWAAVPKQLSYQMPQTVDMKILLPGKPSGPKQQATISQSSPKSAENSPKLWASGFPGGNYVGLQSPQRRALGSLLEIQQWLDIFTYGSFKKKTGSVTDPNSSALHNDKDATTKDPQ